MAQPRSTRVSPRQARPLQSSQAWTLWVGLLRAQQHRAVPPESLSLLTIGGTPGQTPAQPKNP